MKRLFSALLAGSLALGAATAADAAPRGHWRGGHHYRHHDNGAAALGLGLFALGTLAIISAQNRDRYDDRYYDDRYYGPPPRDYYYRDRYDRRYRYR